MKLFWNVGETVGCFVGFVGLGVGFPVGRVGTGVGFDVGLFAPTPPLLVESKKQNRKKRFIPQNFTEAYYSSRCESKFEQGKNPMSSLICPNSTHNGVKIERYSDGETYFYFFWFYCHLS